MALPHISCATLNVWERSGNSAGLPALQHALRTGHDRGGTIAEIFWGLWLFPMGYLVFKSGFFPKILGILLMIARFGYVINSFSIFLGYSVNVGLIATLGELLFILWLLIKDVNVEQWQKRALQST